MTVLIDESPGIDRKGSFRRVIMAAARGKINFIPNS